LHRFDKGGQPCHVEIGRSSLSRIGISTTIQMLDRESQSGPRGYASVTMVDLKNFYRLANCRNRDPVATLSQDRAPICTWLREIDLEPGKGIWTDIFHVLASAGSPPAQLLIDSTAVKAHRCAWGGKGGEFCPAIGRFRGGRTTKIHALTDFSSRPVAFVLTGGQIADRTAADILLEQMPPTRLLHRDKGYDRDAARRKFESKGAAPNIPPKANRRWKNCFSPNLYRDRNAIERMFGRIKDYRRTATRYVRNGVNFLAAVCLAATVYYWL
jgi:transposase